MKTIKLPVYGIQIMLDTGTGEGNICSDDLHETCPKCGQAECIWSCDGAHLGEVESEKEVRGRLAFNGAVDCITSMVLAHAIAGVDVESPAYLDGIETGIETALQACGEK